MAAGAVPGRVLGVHGVHGVGVGHVRGLAPAPLEDGSIPLYHGLLDAAGDEGEGLAAVAITCPFLLSLLLGEGDDIPWGREAELLTTFSWSRLLFAGVRLVSPAPLNSTNVFLCRISSP